MRKRLSEGDINHITSEVVATMEFEGIHLTQEDVEVGHRILSGETTAKQEIERIKKEYVALGE